jgi:CBS domain-containing protein
MQVFELITRDVAVTRRDEPLLEAIRRMREEHVGALVVVEERNGSRTPIGMLTDRDIVVGVFAQDVAHADRLDVGDVMTSEPVTATPEEDIGGVLRRMRSFGVRRIPVVDDAGSLQGIVSIDDIVVGLSEELAEAASLVSRQREREPTRRP